MAKLNQYTLQQIKGTVDPTYTEDLSDSISNKYTTKGTTPPPHIYPTKENKIAAKKYEDQIGRTKIKERQARKAQKMKNRKKIDKIISKKAKARKNAAKDQFVNSITEHMQAIDEYNQEHQA